MVQGQLDFQWARTTMISDDPAKALGPVSPEKLLVSGNDGMALAQSLGIEALWLLRRDNRLTTVGLGTSDAPNRV
ncbi:hypothetical protein QWA_17830 [Alcaligenes faecalis subsp. faecalis NCIB 8687]|nr:hypothetical protein QWA_17830 [Alcaligenes faecalis subsp. faecalis NCIB 8687]